MQHILSAENLRYLDIIAYPQIGIEENAFTFITGESGSGKSTLLKLLNSTLPPSAGSIFYRGRNIAELEKTSYRRKVLLAAQDVFLFEGSIRDNFNLYYRCRDEKPPEEHVIKQALQVCAADFAPESETHILSGGERQRVFLAICLSFTPDVLLLDEPTSALDDKTAHTLLGNIRDFCRRHYITPICVCHSGELTEQYAERRIALPKEAKI